jgi:hypothetical protein
MRISRRFGAAPSWEASAFANELRAPLSNKNIPAEAAAASFINCLRLRMVVLPSKPVPPSTQNEFGIACFSRTGTLACPVLLHWQREDSQEWLSYAAIRKLITVIQGFGGKRNCDLQI